MDAVIAGWGHTPFGAHRDLNVEDLILAAAREALEHAALEASDIDAIWLGHYNAGLVPDGFASSLALQLDDDLRFKPATRVENACASGSAAVYAARDAIGAGRIRTALVIGAEKMTGLDTAGVTEALAHAAYQPGEAGLSFPAIFARFAQDYFQSYGDQSAALAKIAAKNHHAALNNPLAHLRRDLGFEACNTVSASNPVIAAPLRLTDCSPISDGAAALVMVAEDMVSDMPRAVGFRAAVQVNDFLPMARRDTRALPGASKAFANAFATAGIALADLDLADVHDCFTIAELLIYEAMGLAGKGQGARLLDEGATQRGGRLPVNLSGGLKAKGHPVGATGVSMHVMAARQVTGTAEALQLPGASLAAVFNMGGSGVANYCSILEARA
jgi:acetyl-CoA C-acetyltransferase